MKNFIICKPYNMYKYGRHIKSGGIAVRPGLAQRLQEMHTGFGRNSERNRPFWSQIKMWADNIKQDRQCRY